jgi:UDP-glucose 4-epimerase
MEGALVTGGAGFIGSHLVDALMANGVRVCAFDDLSSGSLRNIGRWLGDPGFSFARGDLLEPRDLEGLGPERYDIIFHFAANPEVRVGSTNPGIHFRQNVVATHNLLEHMRRREIAPALAFAST